MRFVRLAAVCGTAIVTANCSLALDGTAPDDVGDAATGGVDSARGWIPDAALASDAPGAHPPVDDAAASVGSDSQAGGGSLCTSANVLFCDGFENGSSAWTVFSAHGSVAIDSSKAYRGRHALHARTEAVTGTSLPMIGAGYGHTFASSLPFPLFIRMFVYMPSPVPPSVGAFVDVLQNASPYAGMQLNIRPPGGYLGGTAYNGLDSDWSATSDLLPPDAWACVEIEIDGPATNLVRVFLSDVELTAMREGLPSDVPPLGILQVGLGYYAANAQAASDLWIDEVAVDGSRIGCSR
jgi:hypothetical protein